MDEKMIITKEQLQKIVAISVLSVTGHMDSCSFLRNLKNLPDEFSVEIIKGALTMGKMLKLSHSPVPILLLTLEKVLKDFNENCNS